MSDPDGRWEAVVLYSGLDLKTARDIVGRLKARMLRVWFAPDFPGTTWKSAVMKALGVAPCAVVLCGPKPGTWELREIDAALKVTTVIPVLLPGVDTIPEELELDLETIVEIRLDELDDSGIEVLVSAVRRAVHTAHAAQAYEIEVDVPIAAQSCVLIAPPQTMSRLRDEVDRAIESLRRERKTAPKSVVELPPRVTAKSVMDIRAAEVLIADCSSVDAPAAIPAAVAYQMGVAHALGKPTILITDPGSRIGEALPVAVDAEARRTLPTVAILERSAEEAFRDVLRRAIFEACSAVSPLLLVDRHLADIRALDRDLKCVRPRLWPEFNRLLTFDLETLDTCQALLQEGRPLQDHVNELWRMTREEWGPVRNELELRARRVRTFLKYQPFRKSYDDHWETWSAKLASGLKTDLDDTLECIEAHLPDDLQDALQKARARWGLIQDDARAFTEHYTRLRRCAEPERPASAGAPPDPDHAFLCLNSLTETDLLKKTMDEVHAALCMVHDDAHSLMTMLLQIILEGSEDVRHATAA
jgi:hypothetical protein